MTAHLELACDTRRFYCTNRPHLTTTCVDAVTRASRRQLSVKKVLLWDNAADDIQHLRSGVLSLRGVRVLGCDRHVKLNGVDQVLRGIMMRDLSGGPKSAALAPQARRCS